MAYSDRVLKLFRRPTCLLLAVVPYSLPAEMCKWVDDNNVTHYSESCPDDVNSSGVAMEGTPSPEQVEEAQKRSDDLQLQQNARKERASPAPEVQPIDINETRERCIKASLSLKALSQSYPVYYDRVGQLQAYKSEYQVPGDSWSPTFLEPDERKRIQKQWRKVRSECSSADPGMKVAAGVKRAQKAQQQQLCASWRAELADLDRIRFSYQTQNDLNKLISENCR